MMKRLTLLLLFLATLNLHAQTVSHDFHNTPLLEALQTINREPSDYTIDVLSDGLNGLTTSVKVKNLSVPDAVKRICKRLPVKVKVKGHLMSVQLRKDAPKEREVAMSGCVIDGFLKKPLPDAKVSVCRADSSVLIDSVPIVRIYRSSTQNLQYAYYAASMKTKEKTLLVRAQLDGYADAWQRVSTDESATINVPNLEMRKVRSITLKEVVVTATKIKMFYRGDTIVYDATAFQMPEGSMLDDLIRQLPGVTMNEQGEIFVNGRKVDELLLGSRTFFGGNKQVLMENLPYYTVKHLKVYEKQSDKSRALGYDVEPRSYVMDVILKDEYSRGYIGNVEVAGGTEDRWLGRGFLLGFTDQLRFTLLANANNVNEGRHIGQTDQWTPERQPRWLQTTHSVAGEISYQSADESVKKTFRADYTSSTDELTQRKRREQFLTVCTPTSLSESYNRSGTKKLTLHNSLSLSHPNTMGKLWPAWLSMNADYSYARRDGWFNSAFDEWNDSLTISQRTAGMREGKAWNGLLEVSGAFKMGGKEQNLTFNIKVEHTNDESEQACRYRTQNHASSILYVANTSQQHNASFLFDRTTNISSHFGWNTAVAKEVNLLITDFVSFRHQHNRDNLHHPDTLLLPSQIEALAAITDLANSYDSHDSNWSNDLVFRLMKRAYYIHPDIHYRIDYAPWLLQISMPLQHEWLHYQRGKLDTLAHQTVLLPNVSFDYRNVWKNGMRDFRFSYHYGEWKVNLLDRITFRDDSQPLVVKLGNPDLKRSTQSRFRAEYYGRTVPRQAQYNLSASFNYYHRIVAQSLAYDPTSGVYTYKPMNINGTYEAHAHFGTNQNIDKKRYWSWHINGGTAWNHAKDHVFTRDPMLDGSSVETLSHINTVNTLTLYSGGNLSFNKKTLNVRAVYSLNWRHSDGIPRSTVSPSSEFNALDFQYGFEARYTTPPLWGMKMDGLTISADGTMFSRRGYGSNELNTDDLVVNASLSQPLFKGKLITRLEVFDLLHQLSNTHYEVNAQGRTVTWYRSLPHYVMLHLVYHFNKNPKKK